MPNRKRRKGRKGLVEGAPNLLLPALIVGGVLFLVGGGIGLYCILRKPASVAPPAVADKDPGKPTPGKPTPDKPTPDKRQPELSPGIDRSKLDEMAKRLVGTWDNHPEAGEQLRYNYRADGTFTLTVKSVLRNIVVSGTWKIVYIGKDDGNIGYLDGKLDCCVLKRSGTLAAVPVFTPNDEPIVSFYSNDMILHAQSDGTVIVLHRPGTPVSLPSEIVRLDPALVKQLTKRLTGRWVAENPKSDKVLQEYRADGTFTIQVTSPTGETSTASGTWKIIQIQEAIGNDACTLMRSGDKGLGLYFTPNDVQYIVFESEDSLRLLGGRQGQGDYFPGGVQGPG